MKEPVWTFDNEKEFKDFVKLEPHHVFGDERIDWNIYQKLPGSPTLPGKRYNEKAPDWMGKDSKGNLVIVEMKFFKNHSGYDLDAIHKSIGQILDYSTAPGVVSPRLYIVVHPVTSPVIEKICQFLRTKGINIKQVSV